MGLRGAPFHVLSKHKKKKTTMPVRSAVNFLVFQPTEMRLTASLAEALWNNVLVYWKLQFIHNVNQEKLKCFAMVIKLDLWHSPCGVTVMAAVSATICKFDCISASFGADCTLMAGKVDCCFVKLRPCYSVNFYQEKGYSSVI